MRTISFMREVLQERFEFSVMLDTAYLTGLFGFCDQGIGPRPRRLFDDVAKCLPAVAFTLQHG